MTPHVCLSTRASACVCKCHTLCLQVSAELSEKLQTMYQVGLLIGMTRRTRLSTPHLPGVSHETFTRMEESTCKCTMVMDATPHTRKRLSTHGGICGGILWQGANRSNLYTTSLTCRGVSHDCVLRPSVCVHSCYGFPAHGRQYQGMQIVCLT